VSEFATVEQRLDDVEGLLVEDGRWPT
jgi:hypothetical protein